MLSLVLTGFIGVQLASPSDAELPDPAQVVSRRERLVVKPLPADFPEIVRRPIFAVDRHPMADAMDGFVLLGTGAVGGAFIALLQAGGRVIRAHNGDSVMGWRITSVAQDRLLFERNEEKRMLVFDVKSRRAAMAPPPVARSK